MSGDCHFCGCCGSEIAEVCGTDPVWCWPCAAHVMREGRVPLHESTYFAQHGVHCPFQVVAP